MTVVHNSEQSVTPRRNAPLHLVRSAGSKATERAALLHEIATPLSDAAIAKRIGNIVTDYKQAEQRQKAKEFKEQKARKRTDKEDYTRDAMDAKDAQKRADMVKAVLRGFGMLEKTVETDFESIYKEADVRAVQSTGNDEEAIRIRREMTGLLGEYFDHPALRGARSIVEVTVVGGEQRRANQTMIMQRAIASIFDKQGIAAPPEA